MNDVIMGVLFFAGLLATGVYLMFCLVSYIEGYSDGELDQKYPSLPQRESDHYEGVRRAVYEIAYARGVAKFERAKARRIERMGR